MTTMVWDEAGARYYETGVSKGIFFPIDGSTGVPWNGLVSVNLDPQGGEAEHYYFDGVKYMDRILAEDFQATIQTITTPKEFRACEGVREYKPGVMTEMNKRDKFHMAWRTEISSDAGESIGYKIHIAYNNLVQPAARNYQTLSDTTTMDIRSFTVTATPACGRHSYFWFDSREHDLSALEAELAVGTLPKCFELSALVTPIGDVPSTDPDAGCPSIQETFEGFFPGQVLASDVRLDFVGNPLVTVHGTINNALDIVELPAVGAFAANDSAASEVGTGDILADDDDVTYITSADGDLGYTVGLPPLVGYVDGCEFELHIRMSISGGVNPDDPDNLDADAQVHISTDAAGDLTIGGFSDGVDEGMGFALTLVDGTPVDYIVPLYMDSWVDTTIDDVVSALEAGAYLNVVGATNNNTDTTPEVRVYEASVVMLDATEPGKILRTYDPTDNTEYGSVSMHIYDVYPADLAASVSDYVDVKIKKTMLNTDFSGVDVTLIAFGDDPRVMKLEASADDAIIRLYDVDGGTVLADYTVAFNTWYRVQIDFGWDTFRSRVYTIDNPTDFLMDYSATDTTQSPTAYLDARSGLFGDADNTFEASIDNARIQVHCNEEDLTPGPPPGDYELILTPSSVTSEGSTDGSHSPFVVGDTTNGLKDGLDTTYGWVTWLRSVKGVYPLWTTVTPTEPTGLAAGDIDPAWVTSIGTRFRAKATESDAVMIPALFGNVSKYLAGKGDVHTPLSFTSAGVWQNFEYFWDDLEYDTTGWAPLGMQSALDITSYLYTRTWPLNPADPTLLGDYNIQISEQSIVIRFTIP